MALPNGRRPKICIVSHSYPRFPGDWHAGFIEALALAYGKQADVTVLVPFCNSWRRTDLNANGVRIVPYRYAPKSNWHTVGEQTIMKGDLQLNLLAVAMVPLMILSGILHLAYLQRRERFDMIHAHWAIPNAIIALLGKYLSFSKVKVFTSFPGSDVTLITSLKKVGRLVAAFIGQSDFLSCNSTDLREDLAKQGIEESRVELVIYGVNDKAVHFDSGKRRALRQKLGFEDHHTVLLMVGRFVPKKGFEVGLAALRWIAKECPDVRMVVVGDGPLKETYLEILRKDGTESITTFVGEVSSFDLSAYYSACDIFVMPSQRFPSDGLNVVVPEAMACGRPIVASNVGGNDLVVESSANGLLHAPKDIKGLAECVINLSRDPGLRHSMGQESLRLVKERYNWDALASYYLSHVRPA